MSLKGLKELVARIHSDKDLRNRFASDPDGVISEYKLTTDERTALKQAHLRISQDGTLAIQTKNELLWWFE